MICGDMNIKIILFVVLVVVGLIGLTWFNVFFLMPLIPSEFVGMGLLLSFLSSGLYGHIIALMFMEFFE